MKQFRFLQTGCSLRRSSDRMRASLLILIGVSVWCPVAGVRLDKPHLSGPSTALEGSVEDFTCKMPWTPTNVSVVLKLYAEGNLNKSIGYHTVLFEELAVFPLVVNEKHDGRLICEASGNNNTEIEHTFSDSLDLQVISPVEGATIVSHLSSNDLWVGRTLTLRCDITRGTHVSYDWLKDGSPLHSSLRTSRLTIPSLSLHHTGDYQCVASNRLNDTTVYNSSSDVISVQVKEHISKPEISLDVVKSAAGDLTAIVRCRCDTGTPLNTFSLLNDTDIIAVETTDRLQALFNVSIQLNRDMGWVRCNASNHGNWMLSNAKSLSVESVGGAVTVTLFKHVAVDFQVFGVVMRCQVERGTFPQYHWYLNNSRLEGRGSFYAVGGTHNSSLSLSVGPHSSGFYHCHASDTFDNANTVRSLKIPINRDALNRVSTSVLVVVFSCLILLVVSVTSCCVSGAVLRRRYSRKYLAGETDVTSTHEDEDDEQDFLLLSGYEEDVIHAERTSDLHSEEDESSVDETVLYDGAVSK
ncbi:cell adhesion molecule DSCAML1 isoform X2 [Triplophysa dalaica]|uniref:cell adhesion molecule DSCAML1 isoform X2 n=1 Tax=Triplophysa dalaica TaxID=1582913 RepID=UPI0024DF5A80|nr:cell adhesion molecule DSCAML1 isoform X2 [Triplophysa dalaica]